MPNVPVMQGATHALEWIALSDEQIDELSSRTGIQLRPHRDEIDVAINDYCARQTIQLYSPRPGELRKLLVQLRKNCAGLLENVRQNKIGNRVAKSGQKRGADGNAEERSRALRESLHSLLAPYRRLDLDIFEFIADVEQACGTGLSVLPSDVGGRQDGQAKFPELVGSLADIFAKADQVPASHWDAELSRYADTPFLRLVAGVNALLPMHLRIVDKKRATTLPKLVSETLAKWRKLQKE